jgi:hypothetical protein
MESIVKKMEADLQRGDFGLTDPKITDFRIRTERTGFCTLSERLEIEIYGSECEGVDRWGVEEVRKHVSSKYGIDWYLIDVVPIHQ